MVGAKEDFTGVYFFDFADNEKPRIAYASSVEESTYEELIGKKKWLEKFSAISTREQYGVDLLKRIIDKDVELVLDPTFLLNKNQWGEIASRERLIKEPYTFLYTLHGLKHGVKWGESFGRVWKEKKAEGCCRLTLLKDSYPADINLIRLYLIYLTNTSLSYFLYTHLFSLVVVQ